MTNEGLSRSGAEGVRKRLDDVQVLFNTVQQLRKDLNTEGLGVPPADEAAFETLRAAVLSVLEERQARGAHALGLVVNRVDLTERVFRDAMDAGGLDLLAAHVVLRCLQKVLARERFAGRG
jgi:hypothetical protein